MENQANSKNIILNYGFYLGVTCVLILLIKYATGYIYVQEWYSGLSTVLLLITFIVLGIKKYKTSNDGLISFEKSVKVGIGLTMICSLIIIAFYLLLSTVIDQDFIQNSIEVKLEASKQEKNENAEQNFYLNMFGGIIIYNLFLGGITSLIS
jgi:glucan phosphoethanolaminetransferase (alkaline phosphatase superfamily)